MPDKKRIVVEISEEMHKRARLKSVQAGIPLTQVVRESLERWLKDDPPPEDERK
jgi:predicted HicB family RNase H-like nuclease